MENEGDGFQPLRKCFCHKLSCLVPAISVPGEWGCLLRGTLDSAAS